MVKLALTMPAVWSVGPAERSVCTQKPLTGSIPGVALVFPIATDDVTLKMKIAITARIGVLFSSRKETPFPCPFGFGSGVCRSQSSLQHKLKHEYREYLTKREFKSCWLLKGLL